MSETGAGDSAVGARAAEAWAWSRRMGALLLVVGLARDAQAGLVSPCPLRSVPLDDAQRARLRALGHAE